jgi:hypothetical protein
LPGLQANRVSFFSRIRDAEQAAEVLQLMEESWKKGKTVL